MHRRMTLRSLWPGPNTGILFTVSEPARNGFLCGLPSSIFPSTDLTEEPGVIGIDGVWMAAKKTDNPHQRTRKDHATETAEDYVEAIAEQLLESRVCRASDLARRFAVSHVTVHRIVTRLQDEGLLVTEPYQPIQLTTKGKRIARESRQRHDLVYRFLQAIGVDPATAARDTEGIEHHVSPKTLECFKVMLQRLENRAQDDHASGE